ncbi:MAG: hypothetical protein J6B45_04725 [Clostridia bacterium]|nr:hypothetical protein [Clostridia bacterium]
MDKRKVIYYNDELNDEFSLAQITPRVIDKNYVYDHKSLFKRFTRFFWYRIVFFPIAILHSKIKFHHKIINQKVIKPYKKNGYFMYGNHTQDIGDAFLPQRINKGKSKYIIVHPNNVSMPVLGKLTPSLGAIPLPDDMVAYKNFIKVIEKRINQKKCVIIYPEAHIWPFYTGIRPFADTSFQYPIKLDVPTFCFTNTYQKRRFSKKPRIVTYVDGPFFPNKELSFKEQRADLRNQVYNCMCKRAENSNVQWIQYIKKEEEND